MLSTTHFQLVLELAPERPDLHGDVQKWAANPQKMLSLLPCKHCAASGRSTPLWQQLPSRAASCVASTSAEVQLQHLNCSSRGWSHGSSP